MNSTSTLFFLTVWETLVFLFLEDKQDRKAYLVLEKGSVSLVGFVF